MTLYNKVVWCEGMFLRPQHFQQQDRYVEHLVRQSSAGFGPYTWGFKELKIDHDLLQTGKFALSRSRGVMPDGTPFDLPEEAAAPEALDLSEKIENATVFLALPVRDARGMDIDHGGVGNGMLRYAVEESEVHDSSGGAEGASQIQVGHLNFRLMLEDEERSGYHCLGLARIVQVGADKTVVFDEDFIPSC
ncbi:MAG: type VI secretion system baseplate subunit TssK, partial [Rhodospirillales bacterium]|nr:type VI secretion system baseplate subunit TssK [Rhodospirillales bacterium]